MGEHLVQAVQPPVPIGKADTYSYPKGLVYDTSLLVENKTSPSNEVGYAVRFCCIV